MNRTVMTTAGVLLGLTAAHATTVTSNTIPGICNAEIVLYGSPTPGGKVTLYQGALARGGIALQLVPSQGTQVCYTRSVDPVNCTGQMTAPVCAPVTASPADILDVR